MYGPPEPEASIWVPAADRGEIGASLPVAGTFDGRSMIDSDLEVIPPRPHRRNHLYRWDHGTHRFTTWLRPGGSP